MALIFVSANARCGVHYFINRKKYTSVHVGCKGQFTLLNCDIVLFDGLSNILSWDGSPIPFGAMIRNFYLNQQ